MPLSYAPALAPGRLGVVGNVSNRALSGAGSTPKSSPRRPVPRSNAAPGRRCARRRSGRICSVKPRTSRRSGRRLDEHLRRVPGHRRAGHPQLHHRLGRGGDRAAQGAGVMAQLKIYSTSFPRRAAPTRCPERWMREGQQRLRFAVPPQGRMCLLPHPRWRGTVSQAHSSLAAGRATANWSPACAGMTQWVSVRLHCHTNRYESVAAIPFSSPFHFLPGRVRALFAGCGRRFLFHKGRA